MKPSRQYPPAHDNEWVQPKMDDYAIRCCDCGLVHKIAFKIKGKQVYLKFTRDNRATGQVRRHQKIKIKHTYEEV